MPIDPDQTPKSPLLFPVSPAAQSQSIQADDHLSLLILSQTGNYTHTQTLGTVPHIGATPITIDYSQSANDLQFCSFDPTQPRKDTPKNTVKDQFTCESQNGVLGDSGTQTFTTATPIICTIQPSDMHMASPQKMLVAQIDTECGVPDNTEIFSYSANELLDLQEWIPSSSQSVAFDVDEHISNTQAKTLARNTVQFGTEYPVQVIADGMGSPEIDLGEQVCPEVLASDTQTTGYKLVPTDAPEILKEQLTDKQSESLSRNELQLGTENPAPGIMESSEIYLGADRVLSKILVSDTQTMGKQIIPIDTPAIIYEQLSNNQDPIDAPAIINEKLSDTQSDSLQRKELLQLGTENPALIITNGMESPEIHLSLDPILPRVLVADTQTTENQNIPIDAPATPPIVSGHRLSKSGVKPLLQIDNAHPKKPMNQLEAIGKENAKSDCINTKELEVQSGGGGKRKRKSVTKPRNSVSRESSVHASTSPLNKSFTDLGVVRAVRLSKPVIQKSEFSSTEPDNSDDEDYGREKQFKRQNGVQVKFTRPNSTTAAVVSAATAMSFTVPKPPHVMTSPLRIARNASNASTFVNRNPSNSSYPFESALHSKVWAKKNGSGLFHLATINSHLSGSNYMVKFDDDEYEVAPNISIRNFSLSVGDKVIYLSNGKQSHGYVSRIDYDSKECILDLHMRPSIIVDISDLAMTDDLFLRNSGVCLPQELETMFKGFGFFLSLSPMNEDGTVSGTTLSDKFETTAIIEGAGGKLYTSPEILFEGNLKKSNVFVPPVLILLANRPLRTKKYLMSLALGVDIISVQWIQCCLNARKLVDMNPYRLSNGYSMDLGHWSCAPKRLHGVFENINVFVQTCSGDQGSNWGDILLAASANLITRKQLKSGIICKYALCDDFEVDGFFGADLESLVLVTNEWVIQCLIQQMIIEPKENLAYFREMNV